MASQLLLSKLLKGNLHYCRCDSSTNFESIFRDALKDAGIDVTIIQIESTSTQDKKIEAKVPIISVGYDSKKEIFELGKEFQKNCLLR